jgi:hypothetical protein
MKWNKTSEQFPERGMHLMMAVLNEKGEIYIQPGYLTSNKDVNGKGFWESDDCEYEVKEPLFWMYFDDIEFPPFPREV